MQQNPYSRMPSNAADSAQQPGMTAPGLQESQFVGPPRPVEISPEQQRQNEWRKRAVMQYLFGDMPQVGQVTINGK